MRKVGNGEGSDRSSRRNTLANILTPCSISPESRRLRHRRAQARYEARQRAGIALYDVPLGASEINALVRLGWLTDGAASDPDAVGEAVAAAISDLARDIS